MKTSAQEPMAGASGPLDVFDRGTSADRCAEAVSGSPATENGASGLKSAPGDLMGFLRGHSVREAAAALGLSRGTVHNLRRGVWPDDRRKILAAWRSYQAKHAVTGSSWFIRRVYADGVVRHARRAWSAHGLAWRVGQLVALSRTGDGELLAQTLELPAERLLLREVA